MLKYIIRRAYRFKTEAIYAWGFIILWDVPVAEPM